MGNPISHGLTRAEVVVAAVIVCLVLVMAVAVLPRSRELSRRLTCGSNLSAISEACKIYAHPNDVKRTDLPSLWPAEHPVPAGKIKYTVPVGAGRGTPESPDRTQPCCFGPGGAEEVSLTRFFWMMVRSGDVQPGGFICPSSGDVPDPTINIERYYDFSGYRHVSYGWQVPFGPMPSAPLKALDTRMALAADKGPYVNSGVATPPRNLSPDAPPAGWTPYNSRNHQGEGQNVLFMDGHATFERTPLAGVKQDNIYTVALDAEHTESRVVGELPWLRSAPPYTIFDGQGRALASTDTVIFP